VEGGKRLRLPIRPIEGEHQLPPELLAVRMLLHERLELLDQPLVAAQLKVGLDSVAYRSQPQLFEPLGLEAERAFVAELSERPSSPQREPARQALARALRGSARESSPSIVDELLEADGIDLPGRDIQPVARLAARDRRSVSQRLPEPGDVRVKRSRCAGRRPAVPELLDQSVRGNVPAGLEEHEREESALPRTAERDRLAVTRELHRPEHAKLGRHLPAAHVGINS
jgi:hypothetical protein